MSRLTGLHYRRRFLGRNSETSKNSEKEGNIHAFSFSIAQYTLFNLKSHKDNSPYLEFLLLKQF